MDANDNRAAELAEIVRQIRERVRASYPEGDASGVALPDLTPVLHARDSALGKVAAIGTVNPRDGGPVNALIQGVKKFVSRAMNWHVREQVEFNRAILRCVETLLEAQSESNRALAELARRTAAFETHDQALRDVTGHWQAWRDEWQMKLSRVEVHFLRSATEAQAAYQQRASLMEANFRGLLSSHQGDLQREMAAIRTEGATARKHLEEVAEAQHGEFKSALDVASREIQARLWKDLEKIQVEYQTLIHHELRLIRQRSALAATSSAPATASPAHAEQDTPNIDWLLFAHKFRGSEEIIKRSFERYIPKFRECRDVLDLGCGRGEFLELMREAGVQATGVDLSIENVALCRQKSLDAEQADMFRYLGELPDESVGGIFCAQVIEHLPPARVPELVRLCATKLRRGAPIVFETPNPECLAIFATHFYIDPTHVRPVPAALMAFYMEEAGLGQIEVTRMSPAGETMPSIEKLPPEFQHEFFDGLDYSISAKRLS